MSTLTPDTSPMTVMHLDVRKEDTEAFNKIENTTRAWAIGGGLTASPLQFIKTFEEAKYSVRAYMSDGTRRWITDCDSEETADMTVQILTRLFVYKVDNSDELQGPITYISMESDRGFIHNNAFGLTVIKGQLKPGAVVYTPLTSEQSEMTRLYSQFIRGFFDLNHVMAFNNKRPEENLLTLWDVNNEYGGIKPCVLFDDNPDLNKIREHAKRNNLVIFLAGSMHDGKYPSAQLLKLSDLTLQLKVIDGKITRMTSIRNPAGPTGAYVDFE